MSRITLGTRGSALALAQVELTRAALLKAEPGIEIEVKKITTSGDRRTDYTSEIESGAGVKGLFTKEIEQALLDGTIDVAVHSCKDLPGHMPVGLEIAATLERADTADVFIGRMPFAELQDRAEVGTSSVRRRRQLLWQNPCIVLEEMRGNVPTRIEKLRASNSLAGIVLARAGLDRLGLNLHDLVVEALPILPAVGQGAIALQCLSADAATKQLLDKINHEPTFLCIRAERELLRLLNGDCHLPVGVETKLAGKVLSMQTVIFSGEGEPPQTASVTGSAGNPEEVAQTLFKQIHS